LLVKHEDLFWKFPGGSVISNESFEDTATREADEELGIEVQIVGEPYVISFTREQKGIEELIVLIHYKATIVDGEPQPCGEVTEFAWHDIDDLPTDCAPNIKLAVEHFLK
jgi:8-oxo-dGTP diphosphatase